jgi:hypothetical protein
MTSRGLESPDELADQMASRTPVDAQVWLAEWLDRRDVMSGELASEQLAEDLDSLAAELRGEALEASTPRTTGLIVAAAVLHDVAGDVRHGEPVAGPVTTSDSPAAPQPKLLSSGAADSAA